MSDVIRSLFGGGSSEQSSTQQSTGQSTQGAAQNSQNQSSTASGNQSTSTSSGVSSGASTTSNYTNPALSGLSGNLADTLRQVLSSFSSQTANAGNPIANATAAPQAGVTSQEQQLLDQITKQTGGGTDSAAYIKSVLGGNFLPGQPGGNPFLDAAIKSAQRPTLEGLSEVLSRTLPGRFTLGGQQTQSNTGDQGGSSAFDRAGAIATRGAANALGDIATNISNTQYGAERQQQTVAAGLDQSQVDQTIKGLQAAALPRLIQQNGLDKGLALFQQQTQNLLEFLRTIGSVQAPTLGANSVSSSNQNANSSSTGTSTGQSSGTSSGASYGQSTTQSTGSSVGSSTTDRGIIPGIFRPV